MVFKQVFGKRTLLLALMVGMLGVLLVACSEDEDPATPAATSASSGGGSTAATAAPTEAMMSGIDYGSLSGTSARLVPRTVAATSSKSRSPSTR